MDLTTLSVSAKHGLEGQAGDDSTVLSVSIELDIGS